METDVAVIGGGVAGMFAARSILQNGGNAIMLDKGPLGHSGSSGINWGHNMSDSFEKVKVNDETIREYITGYVMNHDGIPPQKYIASLIRSSQDAKAFELAQKIGGVLERKASDGTANGEPNPDTWLHTLYPRMLAQYLSNKGLKILDHTMVLDILQAEDGSVTGVVALDLTDGEGILIRCKAVVHAMGSACWNFGWVTAGPKSTGAKECTGDGIAILMRRGVPWTGMEFQWPYWRNRCPDGIAYSQGIGIGGNEHAYEIMNRHGEYFYRTSEAWKDWPTLGTYWKVAYKQLYSGNGFDGYGGDYVMMLDSVHIEEPQNYMRFSRRIGENQHRGLGYDNERFIPMGLEFWETQELPMFDGDTLEVTGFPGCYVAKSSWGAFLGASAGGHLAGINAAKFAKGRNRKPVDLDEVQAVLSDAYAALENESENGVRANTVQHMIQRLVHEKILIDRSEKKLREAVDDLERIRDEVIPNMIVPSKSTHANYEWRQAIEVRAMWIYARAFAESCLARKETRGTHARVDYQDMNNTDFLKQIFVKMDKNGNFSHFMEDIDDSYVPLDELIEKGMLPEIGMGDYPQAGHGRVTAKKLGHG